MPDKPDDKLKNHQSSHSGWLKHLDGRQSDLEDKFDDFASEVRREIKGLAEIVGNVAARRGTLEGRSLILILSVFLAAVGLASTLGHQFVKQEFRLAEQRSVDIVDRMAVDDIRERDDRVRFEKMMETWATHVAEQTGQVADHEARIQENTTELEVFWEWYHPFLQDYGALTARLEDLEKRSDNSIGGNADTIRRIALMEAKLQIAMDHTREDDHPLKQTADIESLNKRLQDAKVLIDRIDREGSRKWIPDP